MGVGTDARSCLEQPAILGDRGLLAGPGGIAAVRAI